MAVLESWNINSTVVDNHTFTIDARYTFPKSKILGIGSYGVVAAAFDTVSNSNVAIKRIRPYAGDEKYAILTLRELRCLKLLSSHPNVIINLNKSIPYLKCYI